MKENNLMDNFTESLFDFFPRIFYLHPRFSILVSNPEQRKYLMHSRTEQTNVCKRSIKTEHGEIFFCLFPESQMFPLRIHHNRSTVGWCWDARGNHEMTISTLLHSLNFVIYEFSQP